MLSFAFLTFDRFIKLIMSLEYVFDQIIQYLLVEVLENFITKTSNYLTNIVSGFRTNQIETNNPFLSNIDILYQSEHFIVLNKPPDLLINSNDNSKITVQTILREQLPSLRNPSLTHEFYFAHRLDFSTSGILCIPLHREACALLSKSFEHQKCKKFYIAVVKGHVKKGVFDVNLAIGEDVRYEATSKKMCTERQVEFCKNPRNSNTLLVLLAHGKYKNLLISKVLLQPITGRRHQLRLHCWSTGHSILGDYTYGSVEDKKMPRMYLHAISIFAPNELEDLHIETQDPFTDDIFGFNAEFPLVDGIKLLDNNTY